MQGEETGSRSRAVETGCKFLLALFGFTLLVLTLEYIVAPWSAAPNLWLAAYITEAGAFAWTFYWYLWHTQGGLRLLSRIPLYMGRFAKAR